MALLHHRLLLLPQCRCALPASMALSRTLSHTHASSSSVQSVPPSLKANLRYGLESWGRGTTLRGLGLGFDDFQRSFASRRFSRVEKARAVLSEVGYTEETDLQLTDPSAQPGDGVDKGLKSMPGSNIVITAGADVGRLALVKSADFIKSSSKESECPGEGYPEIALVGRSNVGKSSLINSLVRRKELAQTSKKPGQ